MRFLQLFCLSFFVCIDGRELKQVQLLHRHGDRTSMKLIPNDPVDWEEVVGVGPEYLTPLGAKQAKQLGAWLRERYVVQTPLLSPNYRAKEVFSRTTNIHRTIMSANLVLSGLYSNNTRIDDTTGHEVFFVESGAPVTMVDRQDEILQAVDFCPYYFEKLIPEVRESQEWKDKLAQEQAFLDWFAEVTGFEVEFSEFYMYYDAVFVQNIHNALHLKELEPHIANISALADWVDYHKTRAGKSYIGGPLLNRIGKDMADMVANKSSAFKFIQHSGHDSTLSSLFSVTGLNRLPQLQRISRYASAFVIELWKEDDGHFSLKTFYRDGVDGTVTELDLFEHESPAKYTTFANLVATKGLTREEWCGNCTAHWDPLTAPAYCLRLQAIAEEDADNNDDDNSDQTDNNDGDILQLKRALVGVSVVLGLTVVSLVIVIIVMRRKRLSTIHRSLLDEHRV
eukprot:c2361_g1_i1.p1 GENE.c2361_g1_i1~~c2361_g1_i1.p1  ORF type:complete len:453 (+),score=94.59 c2361_g1_i1:36-1394(+)